MSEQPGKMEKHLQELVRAGWEVQFSFRQDYLERPDTRVRRENARRPYGCSIWQNVPLKIYYGTGDTVEQALDRAMHNRKSGIAHGRK